MNTCETCRWFGPMSTVNGNLGSCHRYPPRPFDLGHRLGSGGMFPSADFPVVTRRTFCGEHTPRESEALSSALGSETSERSTHAGTGANPTERPVSCAAGRREPTPAMIEAGAAVLHVLAPKPTPDKARAVWDAMWKARD